MHHRILAQMELEQPPSKRQVIGSSPICPKLWVSNLVVECTSHTRVVVSSSLTLPIFSASGVAGSIRGLGSWGRRFKSCLAESSVV